MSLGWWIGRMLPRRILSWWIVTGVDADGSEANSWLTDRRWSWRLRRIQNWSLDAKGLPAFHHDWNDLKTNVNFNGSVRKVDQKNAQIQGLPLVSEDHDTPDDHDDMMKMKMKMKMKMIKFDGDVGYHVMKVIQSWKYSSDESYKSKRSDDLWRFTCGDVFIPCITINLCSLEYLI